MRQTVLSLILTLGFTASAAAQHNIPANIYAESWSADHLREQTFTVDLTAEMTEHAEFVRRWNGSGYRLIFRKIPAGEKANQLEHWVVELKEILSKEKTRREKLGYNLLTVEGGAGGGDNLPLEDRIGILFPKETFTLIERRLGPFYYPISAKRTIKVKSFYVIIQVNNYIMNGKNPQTLDSLDVTVDFKNKLLFTGT